MARAHACAGVDSRANPRTVSGPVLVLACLAVAASVSRGSEPGGIPWRSDFESALNESRVTGRPLWVQFSGPWCMYCRRMEREVFARPDVAALAASDFIPVKVDSEQRTDLVMRFQVVSLPATFILARDQQVRLRRDGYVEAGEFLALLNATRSQPPAQEVALAGNDAVYFVKTGQLTPGSAEFKADFAGMEFRFRDVAARDEFLKSPEQYTPCGGGRCLVHAVEAGQNMAGNPRFGVYYKGRLYLCADKTSREQFARTPERYAQADIAAQGLCAHCAGAAGGKRVQGLPQFTAFYRGLRYLFPDDAHRQAFREHPEQYVR